MYIYLVYLGVPINNYLLSFYDIDFEIININLDHKPGVYIAYQHNLYSIIMQLNVDK